ncbi:MAG: hypothetical protein WBE76_18130 [Terracidiphilus sp.]
MRQVRNITVAVPLDLYLQSRRLAAKYDTTVTAMVAHLLERMPMYLKNANYPVGGPRRPVRGPAELALEEAARRATASPSTPTPHPPPPQNADSARGAATSLATQADSIVSAIPLDEIAAAVRQYDGITNAESVT